jgi:ribonuclease D
VTIRYHKNDLPNLDLYPGDVAIDSETLGLKPIRDRLCVVQLSPGDGSADVVQIDKGQKKAPNLQKLLRDKSKTKISILAVLILRFYCTPLVLKPIPYIAQKSPHA